MNIDAPGMMKRVLQQGGRLVAVVDSVQSRSRLARFSFFPD
jgi:hypothetical protein